MKQTLFALSISFFKIKNEIFEDMRSDRSTDRSFFGCGKKNESPDFQFDIEMISKFFLTFHTPIASVSDYYPWKLD